MRGRQALVIRAYLNVTGYLPPVSGHPPPLGLWRLRHNTARPDILAANESQPVEPLLVGERDTVGLADDVHGAAPDFPILGSVPMKSRAILARCMPKTRIVRTTNRNATSI